MPSKRELNELYAKAWETDKLQKEVKELRAKFRELTEERDELLANAVTDQRRTHPRRLATCAGGAHAGDASRCDLARRCVNGR